MSLRFALLGLLARESLTGYDLTKRFDSSVGFFWSAKHSQIYPELAALTKDGLVTFELVTQTSKPNKKVYTITEAGRLALSDWAATPTEKKSVKDPLLMRTWGIGMIDPDSALEHLRIALVEYEARVAYLQGVRAEIEGEGVFAPSRENPWLGAGLALQAGIMQAESYRDWLRWAIAQMERAAST